MPVKYIRELLLILGAFLFGIGLMIIDELFLTATSTSTPWKARYDWAFPPIGWQGIWTSWEITFAWIIISVALLVVGASLGSKAES